MAPASVPPVLRPRRLKPPQPRPATLTLSSVRAQRGIFHAFTHLPRGVQASVVSPLEEATNRMHARLSIFLVSALAAPPAMAPTQPRR